MNDKVSASADAQEAKAGGNDAGAHERPIIFSGPMVLALLDGRKTQTRRVVKPQPHLGRYGATHQTHSNGIISPDYFVWDGPRATAPMNKDAMYVMLRQCPYGVPGDQLYVKEQHEFITRGPHHVLSVLYKADMAERDMFDAPYTPKINKGRPSVHMPRWASRITLELTEVRVQRLQDTTRLDIVAEGWPMNADQEGQVNLVRELGWSDDTIDDAALEWYADLWDSINGAGSWDANPWVWCLTFRLPMRRANEQNG